MGCLSFSLSVPLLWLQSLRSCWSWTRCGRHHTKRQLKAGTGWSFCRDVLWCPRGSLAVVVTVLVQTSYRSGCLSLNQNPALWRLCFGLRISCSVQHLQDVFQDAGPPFLPLCRRQSWSEAFCFQVVRLSIRLSRAGMGSS